MKKPVLIMFVIVLMITITGCDFWSNDGKQAKSTEQIEESVIKTKVPRDDKGLNFKEEVEKITKSGDQQLIEDSGKKARDASRMADITKISSDIEEMLLMEEALPKTNCTEGLFKGPLGKMINDPSGQGLDSSLTGGFDCRNSYFYSNTVQGATYGVYAKLETPTGNISCEKIGTADLKKGENLYCYAVLGNTPTADISTKQDVDTEYNCERTAGTYQNGRCTCPKGVMEDMYDPKTGYCMTDAGTVDGALGREMTEEFNRRMEMENQ